MLLGDVIVGFRDFLRQHQPIVLHSLGLTQFLKSLWPQHFAEGIRCIYGSIYEHVRNVNTAAGKLGVQ